MIHAFRLLALLLSATSQTPEPGAEARPPSEEGWKNIDGAVLIVNEEMLTARTLLHDLMRRNRRKPFADEGEWREADREVRTERVKAALRVQAGQDLGFDPAEVDRRVKEILRRQQEEFEGSTGMANYLEERDRTLYEEQEALRELLYARSWEQYITGEGAVANLRPSRDSYVRPGYMRFAYRQCLEHPDLLKRIGGSPQTVVLQQLIVDPQSAGGDEPARVLAEDLRRRIVDGEDMGKLVELYGESRLRQWTLEPFPEARLMQNEPIMGAFVAEAQPGDVSEVHEFKSREPRTYLRILRLVERTSPVVPDLASPEVQEKLGRRIRDDLFEWRRIEGFRSLVRASYVWPPEHVPK